MYLYYKPKKANVVISTSAVRAKVLNSRRKPDTVHLVYKPGSQHYGLCVPRNSEITLMSVPSQFGTLKNHRGQLGHKDLKRLTN